MTCGVAYTPEQAEHIKTTIIEFLLKTPMGTISEACLKANIPYGTFWEWQKKDEELKARVKEAMRVAHEMGGDFAESKLRSKINNDDTTSLIFYLKSKHKDRGYVERQENALDVKEGVSFTLSLNNNNDKTD